MGNHISTIEKETSPVISMNDVSLVYKTQSASFKAVDNIDLSINEGSFVCVLGPSGCGKTTLLRMIAGFEEPTSGEMYLDGSPMSHQPDKNRGVVFQNHSLYPWLSVGENVEFGLKMKKVKKADRDKIVDHYLEMVGLLNAKHKSIYELSGGMRQRVAIARVLANDPRIILMDEPFGALDAITKEKMQDNVRSIWKKTKKTFFFVTHDVEEALLLGTDIIVMTPGPGRIISKMKNSFPGEKLNDPSQNFRTSLDFIKKREEIMELIRH